MNRHTIIRIIIAVIWLIVGVIRLTSKDLTFGILSILIGAAFGFTAYMQLTKKK